MNMLDYLVLILPIILVIGLVLSYFYILWRSSGYRFESQNSFIKVHAFLFMDCMPRIFRGFFKISQWVYGEYLIFRELEKIPWYGKILTNLYLPQWETVTSTELDILFVHESWIYVIESKAYSGWIFGNESETYWTEQFSRNRRYQFYNPIRQNYSHLKSLEKILKTQWKFIPVVVFTNRATLKKINIHPDTIVMNRRDLHRMISNQSNKLLTLKQIDIIAAQLVPYKNPSTLQEKIHIAEVIILQNQKREYLKV